MTVVKSLSSKCETAPLGVLLALEEVDEGPQRAGHVAAAVVIEERSGEWRQPVVEHPFPR
jgi:hypothetical protein